MKIKIITPERTVYHGEATQVLVPGKKAPFALRSHHQAIISSLDEGKVKISRSDGSTLFVEVKGMATVEQHDDDVTILAAEASLLD